MEKVKSRKFRFDMISSVVYYDKIWFIYVLDKGIDGRICFM